MCTCTMYLGYLTSKYYSDIMFVFCYSTHWRTQTRTYWTMASYQMPTNLSKHLPSTIITQSSSRSPATPSAWVCPIPLSNLFPYIPPILVQSLQAAEECFLSPASHHLTWNLDTVLYFVSMYPTRRILERFQGKFWHTRHLREGYISQCFTGRPPGG